MYDHDQHAFEPFDPAEIGPARSALIVLGAAAAVVALLAYGIYLNRSEEQHRAEQRRLKAFAAVKAGRGGDVSVTDGQLITMLALDPECVANCTTLVFTNVDFDDDGFQLLSELKNLADVGVYSSDNVDLLLAYLHESTALEKLWIESSEITDAGISLITGLPRLQHLHFQQEMPLQQISYLKTARPKLKLGYVPASSNERVR